MMKKCALTIALASLLGPVEEGRASDRDYDAYCEYSSAKEYARDCYIKCRTYYAWCAYYYAYYACSYAYAAWYYDACGDSTMAHANALYHYSCGYCCYCYASHDYDYNYELYRRSGCELSSSFCCYYAYYGACYSALSYQAD